MLRPHPDGPGSQSTFSPLLPRGEGSRSIPRSGVGDEGLRWELLIIEVDQLLGNTDPDLNPRIGFPRWGMGYSRAPYVEVPKLEPEGLMAPLHKTIGRNHDLNDSLIRRRGATL